MTQGNQKGLDQFKIVANEALIPELRAKGERLRQAVKKITTAVHDRLRHLNIFKPAFKNQGDAEIFEVVDNTRRIHRFPLSVSSKGWDMQKSSPYNYLSYINKFVTLDRFKEKIDDAFEKQKMHLSFHKRVIDLNPLIGYSWLLARNFAAKLCQSTKKIGKEHGIGNKRLEQMNEAARYERHLHDAEKILQIIETVFENIEERINDAQTRAFLRDLKTECEMLILDVCNASFGIFHLFIDELVNNNPGMPYAIIKSSYPLSMKDYAQRERQILELRNFVALYESELVLSEFPMPTIEHIRANGSIELPSIIASDDLGILLGHYESFWSGFAARLQQSKHFNFYGTHAKLSSIHQIGIQPSTPGVQARLAFRIPEFNLRVDRDERSKSMTLDVGSASVDYVLAGIEKFFNAFMTTSQNIPSVFSNLIELEEKEKLLEHQIAYLASATMVLSQCEGLRGNTTISHHSREYIGKQEYYDNFEHILSVLRGALEKK